MAKAWMWNISARNGNMRNRTMHSNSLTQSFAQNQNHPLRSTNNGNVTHRGIMAGPGLAQVEPVHSTQTWSGDREGRRGSEGKGGATACNRGWYAFGKQRSKVRRIT